MRNITMDNTILNNAALNDSVAPAGTPVRIGYQGLLYSNNHKASSMMSARFETPVELIPLMSSANVMAALKAGEIDYGVMAFGGTGGWTVAETEEACKGVEYEVVDSICNEVHHNLFRKRGEIPPEAIRTVASHPVALRVCVEHIETVLPGREKKIVADTALAAEMLASGELPEDTAVICSLDAGTNNGLSLIQANIEDRTPNGVFFKMIRLK